jgi:hypothetical protein
MLMAAVVVVVQEALGINEAAPAAVAEPMHK